MILHGHVNSHFEMQISLLQYTYSDPGATTMMSISLALVKYSCPAVSKVMITSSSHPVIALRLTCFLRPLSLLHHSSISLSQPSSFMIVIPCSLSICPPSSMNLRTSLEGTSCSFTSNNGVLPFGSVVGSIPIQTRHISKLSDEVLDLFTVPVAASQLPCQDSGTFWWDEVIFEFTTPGIDGNEKVNIF